MSNDILIVYGLTSFGFFCIGYAFCFLTSRKHNNQPKEIKQETKRLTTQCYNCRTVYQFVKNQNGDTVVQCPKCLAKAIIK